MNPKTNKKKYEVSSLYKDYFINFIAGLMSGFTILYFGFLLPYALSKKYVTTTIGFVIYILIGLVLFALGWFYVKKKFAKEK